jgi:chromosome partitioning protein
MANKVITIAALKGGSSRSTLATNLSGALSEKAPTLLADLDTPQHTSASWAAVRQENQPQAAPGLTARALNTYEELLPVIQRHKQGFVVIDTAPRLAEASRAAVLLADLVLVPCSPEVATIWALQDTLDLIKEARKQRPSIKARLVWVRVRQTSATAELQATATGEFKSIKAMKTSMGYRQSYQTALGNGTTVMEQNKDRLSKKELSELVAEVLTTIR